LKFKLYELLEQALLQSDAGLKCDMVKEIHCQWQQGNLQRESGREVLPLDNPGMPDKPELVDPSKLARRSIGTEQGRITLLHAVAHIEFNAINIALDAAYRFQQMPDSYVGDWLLVASEEALHFTLLKDELEARNSYYGAFDAHRGLWDMVCKTRHDVLHRMALVPRVMEARGLDVTPAMIKKFRKIGDESACDILQRIYQDEIGHVRIGNHWFQYLCEQRGIDLIAGFRSLIAEYLGEGLRGPFNWEARQLAGFSRQELASLEADIRR
jgi:uncharacterized ferritin-like protein (DUF455 family)